MTMNNAGFHLMPNNVTVFCCAIYVVLHTIWFMMNKSCTIYRVVGLFSNPHGLFFSLLFALLPPSSTTTKLGDNPTDPKLCQSRNCFHRHQYLKVEKGANSSVIIYRVFQKQNGIVGIVPKYLIIVIDLSIQNRRRVGSLLDYIILCFSMQNVAVNHPIHVFFVIGIVRTLCIQPFYTP